MKGVAERSRLGAALRALRRQKGWTLAEVSRRTGFSVPTLSKVENGRLSLSYDKLIRVSEGLEVDIAQLFSPVNGAAAPATITGRRSINKVGEGDLVGTRNYDYLYLSGDVTRKKFVPILTEVHAHSIEEFGELVRHAGDEFVYVLEGELEVHTELYAPVVLAAGESAYLDSTMGHAYVARGTSRCRLLAVCSAAERDLREVTGETNARGPQTRRPVRAKRPARHR
jgi:transcriptional regulator with XRE-family HTH domain/mannose-6-phosphate isomerase-like protein (cupin superfamily)